MGDIVSPKKVGAAAAVPEEIKAPNTSKSPFRSSNPSAAKSQKSPGGDDDIEEDIVQDHEDILLKSLSPRDQIAASGGASSFAGID